MANVLTSCNDSRYKCGAPLASACVFYTAEIPTYFLASTFPCNVNIDDVFNVINPTIQTILTGNDLTGLTPLCLSFNPATITIKDLHQLEISHICALHAQADGLQNQINDINVGVESLTIDLQCLTPNTNPCSSATNNYSLFFVLTTMLTKICSLQDQINALQTQVNLL